MRRQESQSPQQSSFRRSQLAACANTRASVYLPIPRGPVKSRALGTRSRFNIPRRALTIRWLPRNSLNPICAFTITYKSSSRCSPGFQEASFDRLENFSVDCVRRAKSAGLRIEAFNAHPVGLLRKFVIDFRGGFQMSDAGFEDVALKLRVVARTFLADKPVSFRYRNAQIDDEILSGQHVDLVFELLEPVDEFPAVFATNARTLVGEIRSDIAVCQNGSADAKF